MHRYMYFLTTCCRWETLSHVVATLCVHTIPQCCTLNFVESSVFTGTIAYHTCSSVHYAHKDLPPLQVWGNIQDYEDPSRIVFDLDNSKHWKSLFYDTQPLTTVQVDTDTCSNAIL